MNCEFLSVFKHDVIQHRIVILQNKYNDFHEPIKILNVVFLQPWWYWSRSLYAALLYAGNGWVKINIHIWDPLVLLDVEWQRDVYRSIFLIMHL